GTLDYRVLAPPVAPEAGEGLPTTVASTYRPAATIPERLLAMGLGAARPGPLRAALRDATVVHYPLTIRIPSGLRPAVVTVPVHRVQLRALPALFPRAERRFRAAAWHPSVRRADLVIVPSAFVRERAVERLGLNAEQVRVVPSGVDHRRFSPGDEPREPLLL